MFDESPVLRSRNYLYSTPAPTLSIISATALAPATAIYSTKLTAENVYLNLFSAPAQGPQIISAPPAPAPQHWMELIPL